MSLYNLGMGAVDSFALDFNIIFSRHYGNRHFGTVDIMGIDILPR